MRAVVQRVTNASVTVENETVGAIGPGIMVLIGGLQHPGCVPVHALRRRPGRPAAFLYPGSEARTGGRDV